MESGIEKMVARIDDPDGPFYTISQVAGRVGVSKDTIRRWGDSLGIPSHKMETGDHPNAFCWLYTEGDISALAKLKT
jgi:excisionase family DNA binding protein